MTYYDASITQAVARILRDSDPMDSRPPAEIDAGVWRQLVSSGYVWLAVPEELGGGGASVRYMSAVIDCAAYHAARVPLVEAGLLVAPMLELTGQPVPAGPVTACLAPHTVSARAGSGRVVLDGSATAVPWVPGARQAVLLTTDHAAGSYVAIVDLDPAPPPGQLTIRASTGIGGEPRHDLCFAGLDVPAVEIASDALPQLRLRGALGRSIQLAAAARRIRDLTVTYAQVRQQFGRPIGSFQAVQQNLAALAGQTAAMAIASQAAVEAMADGDESAAEVPIAAAKAYCSNAVRQVAAIAHQVHGAIGFSSEHRLGAFTTRLWSWRDEYGSETEWATVLGTLSAQVPDGPWALISGVSSSHPQ